MNNNGNYLLNRKIASLLIAFILLVSTSCKTKEEDSMVGVLLTNNNIAQNSDYAQYNLHIKLNKKACQKPFLLV